MTPPQARPSGRCGQSQADAVRNTIRQRRAREGGYLLVLFVIIVAFVGVLASMHVLVLTSVATTSRAYDSYRQAGTELTRIEHAVTETLLDARQISVQPAANTLADALAQHLSDLAGGNATVAATTIPTSLPTIITYPSASAPPDPLGSVPADLESYLTPELVLFSGNHVAAYPDVEFQFTSQRSVLDSSRTYGIDVKARLLAVPLTRFAVAAYELPADIGADTTVAASGPVSLLPQGLVPARDTAFVHDLQSQAGVLPYHYRRRAALAAAYQYVFSQSYVDRVAEYAGITHFCDLGASSGTAVLAGMSRSGLVATWDVGGAGSGTYDTITLTSEATVVFTEAAGHTLQLLDSVGDSSRPAMFVLALGPSNAALGPLTINLATIARPIILIGYNVRITADAGTAVNGAMFLDAASSMAPAGPITLGHLSYWAGTTSIPATAVMASGAVPTAVESMAPRVVYVAAKASRL